MAADIPEPAESVLDTEALDHLLRYVQDGVVSRRQLLELGARDHDTARMLRRRELARIHRAVFVNHTGKPSYDQRAWAAVLACWPAALSHESALPQPSRQGPVHVAIALGRTVRTPRDVVVHRLSGYPERVHPLSAPPRIRLEHAALDVALSRPGVAGRFRVLADACQSRETTAERIAAALKERDRVPDRQLLLDLLDDLATGATSVLERGYLDLERCHGLPAGRRQGRAELPTGRAYRDVRYDEFGVVVELDGRAYHDSAAARDRDFERDLDTHVESNDVTIRLTYGQVHDRGCQTIRKVGLLLQRRGWAGPIGTCQAC